MANKGNFEQGDKTETKQPAESKNLSTGSADHRKHHLDSTAALKHDDQRINDAKIDWLNPSVIESNVDTMIDKGIGTAKILSNAVVDGVSNFIDAGANAAAQDGQATATKAKDATVSGLKKSGVPDNVAGGVGHAVDVGAGAASYVVSLGHGINKFLLGTVKDGVNTGLRALGGVLHDGVHDPTKAAKAMVNPLGAMTDKVATNTSDDIAKAMPGVIDATGKAFKSASDAVGNAIHDPSKASSDAQRAVGDTVKAAVTDDKSVVHAAKDGAWAGQYVAPAVVAAVEAPAAVRSVVSAMRDAAAVGAKVAPDIEAGAAAAKSAAKIEAPTPKFVSPDTAKAIASEVPKGAQPVETLNGQGVTSTKYSDGTITQAHKDGSAGVHKPDGTSVHIDQQGHKEFYDSNGKEIKEPVKEPAKAPDWAGKSDASSAQTPPKAGNDAHSTKPADVHAKVEPPHVIKIKPADAQPVTKAQPDWLNKTADAQPAKAAHADTATPKTAEAQPAKAAHMDTTEAKTPDAQPAQGDASKPKSADTQAKASPPDWLNTQPADSKPAQVPKPDATSNPPAEKPNVTKPDAATDQGSGSSGPDWLDPKGQAKDVPKSSTQEKPADTKSADAQKPSDTPKEKIDPEQQAAAQVEQSGYGRSIENGISNGRTPEEIQADLAKNQPPGSTPTQEQIQAYMKANKIPDGTKPDQQAAFKQWKDQYLQKVEQEERERLKSMSSKGGSAAQKHDADVQPPVQPDYGGGYQGRY